MKVNVPFTVVEALNNTAGVAVAVPAVALFIVRLLIVDGINEPVT